MASKLKSELKMYDYTQSFRSDKFKYLNRINFYTHCSTHWVEKNREKHEGLLGIILVYYYLLDLVPSFVPEQIFNHLSEIRKPILN